MNCLRKGRNEKGSRNRKEKEDDSQRALSLFRWAGPVGDGLRPGLANLAGGKSYQAELSGRPGRLRTYTIHYHQVFLTQASKSGADIVGGKTP